jgi:hypothetical protein
VPALSTVIAVSLIALGIASFAFAYYLARSLANDPPRKRITLHPSRANHLRRIVEQTKRDALLFDDLGPLPFVDAIATPDPDRCPYCRKTLAATDEVRHEGGAVFSHSRCWMRGGPGEAA